MKNPRASATDPVLPLALSGDPVRQFAEFEQLLVANSGEDAFDVAVKLVAAKLEDELRARDGGAARTFLRAASPVECHAEVEALLRGAAERWSGVVELDGGLPLTPEQLVRCGRTLSGWDILDTSFHHLDAMLERLVARGSKGALGQYFTPRPVIRMCVAAVSPGAGDTVLDPACGSGGFLVEALEHAEEAGAGSSVRCLGIDYSARSLKVASLLAVAAGRDRVRVDRANSIDGRAHEGAPTPTAWSGFVDESATGPWGAWSRLSASLVLTNPPFAGDIDEPEIIDAYASQRGAAKRGAVTREHLFLERAVRLLKPGGRLAIVLPQGVLANASASYLRKWLMREVRVLAVVGLHPHTFFPHTGVKTSVLFAVRERPPKDHDVLFLSSADPGKDSRGRVTGDGDYARLAGLVQQFARSEGYAWAAPVAGDDFRPHLVPMGEVEAADRLDAEFFDAATRRTHRRAADVAGATVRGRTVRDFARFKKRDFSEIDYIDIGSVDARTGIAVPTRLDAAEAPSRASVLVQQGDVLVSTVRPDRNVVALVHAQPDGVAVASSGFCVLRPKPGLAPELLYAYCKSDLFRSLVSRHATASMYPAVTDGDVLGVPLLLPDAARSDAVVDRVRSALAKVEAARRELAEAVALLNAFHEEVTSARSPGGGAPSDGEAPDGGRPPADTPRRDPSSTARTAGRRSADSG